MQELADAFENDTSTFNTVAQKALQAFQAAEAAKKARDLVRRKNAIVRSTLPGKLADCSATDLQSTEIFLVEGDSAGAQQSQEAWLIVEQCAIVLMSALIGALQIQLQGNIANRCATKMSYNRTEENIAVCALLDCLLCLALFGKHSQQCACVGGSAKQARDRKFQAILPLRGKILNVEKIDQNRLYDNKEVNDMIIALGLRIQEQAGKLRYGKVVSSLLMNVAFQKVIILLATKLHLECVSAQKASLPTCCQHL